MFLSQSFKENIHLTSVLNILQTKQMKWTKNRKSKSDHLGIYFFHPSQAGQGWCQVDLAIIPLLTPIGFIDCFQYSSNHSSSQNRKANDWLIIDINLPTSTLINIENNDALKTQNPFKLNQFSDRISKILSKKRGLKQVYFPFVI